MTKPSFDIAQKFVDACKAGAGDAAGCFAAALDSAMQIDDVGDAEQVAASELPEDLAGPGLILAFQIEDVAIALLLPEATKLLPPWYTEPDDTGTSKLQTLAQELSMLLLPEDLAADKFAAVAADNVGERLRAAEVADPAGVIRLAMSGDDGGGAFYLLWPVHAPASLQAAAETSPDEQAADGNAASQADDDADSAVPEAASDEEVSRRDALPSYLRSLLSIQVPVVVNLAETKMTVDEVVHLGPGAIIQFEKSCEEMLSLEAGGHKIADGEAVKVGEKFGLRITSIHLPEERYKPVGQ